MSDGATIMRVRELVERLRTLPNCELGGPLHIVVDDGNVDDSHLDFCERDIDTHWSMVGSENHGTPTLDERQEIKRVCLAIIADLRSLTRPERFIAVDLEEDEAIEERFELPAVTAPTFPWEIMLNESAVFYQRLIGGGMAVKFVAVAMTQGGWAPLPPGVVIVFNDKTWERFKREVAADGEKAPMIETATHVPRLHTNGETL